jgi:hypothetical protein
MIKPAGSNSEMVKRISSLFRLLIVGKIVIDQSPALALFVRFPHEPLKKLKK